jgi:hypothetical protein
MDYVDLGVHVVVAMLISPSSCSAITNRASFGLKRLYHSRLQAPTNICSAHAAPRFRIYRSCNQARAAAQYNIILSIRIVSYSSL